MDAHVKIKKRRVGNGEVEKASRPAKAKLRYKVSFNNITDSIYNYRQK